MAYKKVWKNGSVDWGAALSNSAKKSAVARRKRDRERERDRKKAERERESARKKREREALKRRNASIRESARATKANERIAAAEARVTQRAKISSAKQEQKLLDQERKERVRVEKKLNTLKGRFLEYDIPLKLFNIDLRVEANNYNEKNGLTTVSQFKKVTIPYLEENLFKLAIKIHIDNTFDLLYESELKKVVKSPKIFNHSQISKFKSKCKAFLKGTLPKNLNFEDFASFADPINAEAISEFIEVNILPIVPEIKKEIDAEIAAIKKQEEEDKQKAKAKKELDDACKKVELKFEKTISESVKLGKSMKTQISKMKSDLVAIDKSYNSAWFNKSKFALEAQGLCRIIWKRTPPLIEHIITIEGIIRILKNRAENSSIEIHSNPKVNQVLEGNGYYEKILTRFGKLYLALYKNLEMRLTNLEKALSYFEDDRELKAIEKITNEGLELSKDSKNISKLFITFGGQDGS
jgi:hypothetical protein